MGNVFRVLIYCMLAESNMRQCTYVVCVAEVRVLENAFCNCSAFSAARSNIRFAFSSFPMVDLHSLIKSADTAITHFAMPYTIPRCSIPSSSNRDAISIVCTANDGYFADRISGPTVGFRTKRYVDGLKRLAIAIEGIVIFNNW